MLVTCCPDCETTFRITVGILEKAGGQVRCGRCAKVFDANIDLREVDEAEAETKPVSAFRFELEPDPEIETESEAVEPQPAADESEHRATEAEPDEVEPDLETAEAEELETEAPAFDAEAATAQPDWLTPLADEGPKKTWPWMAGAALLCLTLAGQMIHQFRNSLITVPAIGPALELIYSSVGVEVLAPVDLTQFNLLDLTALAEPANDEQGWLIIETRVQNRGPKVQPYPFIFVRLEDRWEDTVAGRYFSPEEYTVSAVNDFSHMNVGATIDAQFIIMDPGPSATGFELELCARIVRGYQCESDLNFR